MMAIGASDGFSRGESRENFSVGWFWPCRRRVGEGADDPTSLFVALAKDVTFAFPTNQLGTSIRAPFCLFL